MKEKGQSLEGIVILLIFLFGFMALFYILPIFYTFPAEMNVDSSHTEALATNTSEAFTNIFANFNFSALLIPVIALGILFLLSTMASGSTNNIKLILILVLVCVLVVFLLMYFSGTANDGNFTFSGDTFDGSESGFSGGGGGGFS